MHRSLGEKHVMDALTTLGPEQDKGSAIPTCSERRNAARFQVAPCSGIGEGSAESRGPRGSTSQDTTCQPSTRSASVRCSFGALLQTVVLSVAPAATTDEDFSSMWTTTFLLSRVAVTHEQEPTLAALRARGSQTRCRRRRQSWHNSKMSNLQAA